MRFSKHTERAVLPVVAAVLTVLASNSIANAQESLRIGLPVPGESIYSPVYVAEEAGIYAKKGLKVEITPYRGAGAAQESLAAGGADIINLVPSGAAVAISKGVKEQIVGCGPQLAPDEWHIMVLANSPAKTVKDLNGQKIGVPAKNGTSDYYAQWAAEKAGITVQPTPLGGNTWAPLKAGQIQASIETPSVALRVLPSGEGRSLLAFKAAMELEPNYPMCWTASADIIKSKPAAVKAFVEAVQEATAKMQSDRAYSISFLKKYLAQNDDAYLGLTHDRVITTLANGNVDLKILAASLNLAKYGGVTNLPDPASMVIDYAVKK